MATDKERTEDLNPHGEDIEEKIRRMLDPRVSDEPETSAAKSEKPTPKTPKIQRISIPLTEAEESSESQPSAPELPTLKSAKTKAAKKAAKPADAKKVIIPIAHEFEEEANKEPEEEVAERVIPEETTEGSSEETEDNEVPDAETPDVEEAETVEEVAAEAVPVKKITIAAEDETTAEVAEKLDEAIAELSPEGTDEDEATVTKDEESEPAAKTEETKGEVETEEEPLAESEVLVDPGTDKAVDEIVAKESDELLEIEDAVRDTDKPIKVAKKPKKSLSQTLKEWWAKPGFRWSCLILVMLGLVSAATVPTSRYFILNTVGVRASSSLVVLDDSTQQPLKNVQVKLGAISGVTDEEGKVKLSHIRLGSNALVVEKRAFAPVTKSVIVGWGSNPLGDFRLTPTGTQYAINVNDFLSGKPLAKVAADSGEANALSDDKGIIKLTFDKPGDQQLVINLKADGFRDEQLTLDPNDKSPHTVKLVPARKHVFVSKRSGKYDIYSVYIDGKDEKLVLAGTGNEREDMVLVPHPSANVVAYVSTRGNQHNSENFLLSNLILITLDDNNTSVVATSERIRVVDWAGDRLVYVQIAAGSSANSPKRYRLMSYNYQDGSNKELASSNFFNDVVAASGFIYYAPSSAYQTGGTNFYKINADGSGNQVVLNKEVWNIFRTAYDHLSLSVEQQWYDYRLGDTQPTKLNAAPATQISRVYISSPDGKHSIWIDNRDGKGVLLSYDPDTKVDTSLQSQSGLVYPITWLSSKALVYRIKSGQETADYAISLDGGDSVRIRDVTNSGGLDRW